LEEIKLFKLSILGSRKEINRINEIDILNILNSFLDLKIALIIKNINIKPKSKNRSLMLKVLVMKD
jgi:hypothetical protein|tara:strand:- start:50 stop:247 length:198 start_codon:yes stop_codon:yes gene_type:complete